MMKKFLNLGLVASMLFCGLAANADKIKIGRKSFPQVFSAGLKEDAYYSITVSNINPSAAATAFLFFIPNELFANGTYDLEYLPSTTNSVEGAVAQCKASQDSGEDIAIDLPSNDKIYVIASSLKFKQRGNFSIGKGVSLAQKDLRSAQVTLSGIGSALTSPAIEEVTLSLDATKLPYAKSKFKVFISEDCDEIGNRSKFTVSRRAKRAKTTIDATATVVTIPEM